MRRPNGAMSSAKISGTNANSARQSVAKIVSSGLSSTPNSGWALFRSGSSSGNTVFSLSSRNINSSKLSNKSSFVESIDQNTNNDLDKASEFPALVTDSTFKVKSNTNIVQTTEDFPELPGVNKYNNSINTFIDHSKRQQPSQMFSREIKKDEEKGKQVEQDASSLDNEYLQKDKYLLKGILPILIPSRNSLPHIALGDDIYRLGLDLDRDHGKKLSETFVSPWDETSSSAEPVDLDPFFVLPECYKIASELPPAILRMSQFSDETLFYIFYLMPRDELQEAAALELSNRNWGYHKEWKLWLTKDPNYEPIHCTYQSERGVYIFWDVTNWEPVSKEVVLNYNSLELISQPLPQIQIEQPKFFKKRTKTANNAENN